MDIGNWMGKFSATRKMKIGKFAECSTVDKDYQLETGEMNR